MQTNIRHVPYFRYPMAKDGKIDGRQFNGGARENSGRSELPPDERRVVTSFRIHSATLAEAKKIFGKDLSNKVNDYLKREVAKHNKKG